MAAHSSTQKAARENFVERTRTTLQSTTGSTNQSPLSQISATARSGITLKGFSWRNASLVASSSTAGGGAWGGARDREDIIEHPIIRGLGPRWAQHANGVAGADHENCGSIGKPACSLQLSTEVPGRITAHRMVRSGWSYVRIGCPIPPPASSSIPTESLSLRG
jgi:hypothetical protein